MKWRPGGNSVNYVSVDPPGYDLNRHESPHGITYIAIHGGRIIHIERNVDPADRVAARDRVVAACEAHASASAPSS